MTIERHPVTDRKSWLAMRRDFLTASDVPAVAGVDPYKSALRVYAEKTGLVPDIVENAAMKRGRLFEGAALEYLAEEHPRWQIDRPSIFLTDDIDRLGCTPDAYIYDEAGTFINCQIKTINRYTFDRWNGQAPLGYQLQVVCENMLTGADRGILAVLVVSAYDAELKLFDVPRHEAAEDRIRQLALEFWDRVASGRRPDPDYAKDADVIQAMFPQSQPEPVLDLSADNRLPALLDERVLLKDDIVGAEMRLKTIDTEIKAKLGEHEVAMLPGWKITWKTHTRPEHVVKETTSRPLVVKQIENKEQAA